MNVDEKVKIPKILRTIELVKAYLSDSNVQEKLKLINQFKVIKIEKVTGGYCNYVYRLFSQNGTTHILKFYPPYLSGLKELANESESKDFEDYEVSQERYFVEKNALQIVGDDESLAECRIKTPKIYSFDDDQFVLVMEDCGQQAITLDELLMASYKLPDSIKVSDERAYINEIIDLLSVELSKFLKKLSFESQIKYSTHKDDFEVIDMVKKFKDFFNSVLPRRSKELNLERELEYFIKNNTRIEEPDEESYYCNGECTPIGILIDIEKKSFWLIDWEISRFQRSYTDLELFCTMLWLNKHSPQYDHSRVERILKRIQLEYFVGDERADWRTKCGKYSKENFVVLVLERMNFPYYQFDKRQVQLEAIELVKRLCDHN